MEENYKKPLMNESMLSPLPLSFEWRSLPAQGGVAEKHRRRGFLLYSYYSEKVESRGVPLSYGALERKRNCISLFSCYKGQRKRKRGYSAALQ
ncbi:UNVERIFIED_CONTAM: hypothetical protein Sangu_0227900 [Sesamum angustifolium]|uniref:Uncharacterized protein n=1 Tax=Sesamum angustifolium TaxID=2727405 RepID=A0AAW2RN69_9LAMI